ncbi:hypothetical protein F5Y17DRAFT_477650 [Xylariaceae sp. FL0594]|nr:hypothetical protein F5Y17DRAFT_477650 [Xylariaceae sp. FL0594]
MFDVGSAAQRRTAEKQQSRVLSAGGAAAGRPFSPPSLGNDPDRWALAKFAAAHNELLAPMAEAANWGLSKSEEANICQALYRYGTFQNLFGRGRRAYGGSAMDAERGFPIDYLATLLRNVFNAWDIEAMAYIDVFMQEKYLEAYFFPRRSPCEKCGTYAECQWERPPHVRRSPLRSRAIPRQLARSDYHPQSPVTGIRFTNEADWCQFAEVEHQSLAHGWHLLCSGSPENLTLKTTTTIAEQDAVGAAFFARKFVRQPGRSKRCGIPMISTDQGKHIRGTKHGHAHVAQLARKLRQAKDIAAVMGAVPWWSAKRGENLPSYVFPENEPQTASRPDLTQHRPSRATLQQPRSGLCVARRRSQGADKVDTLGSGPPLAASEELAVSAYSADMKRLRTLCGAAEEAAHIRGGAEETSQITWRS